MKPLSIPSRSSKSITVDLLPTHQCTLTCKPIDYDIVLCIQTIDTSNSQYKTITYHPKKINANTIQTITVPNYSNDITLNLVIIFDNSHSMLRSKNIEYDTMVSETNLNNTIYQQAIVGANLFFDNKVFESEQYFETNGANNNCIFALAHGAISFLRAMMTYVVEYFI